MALRPEALALMAEVNKKFGERTVIVANDMLHPDPFTTGSLSLDLILGGGFPANQWTEIIGEESNGKTAVVLKTIAANQQRDPDFTTLWIAAEHYDADQATALGVDNDRVIVIPTQDMTFAFDQVIKFLEAHAIDAAVIDSYPALIPPEEEEKSMDDVQVALGARVTGKFFRKVGSAGRRDVGDRPFMGLFINQFRDKIGGFAPRGTPKTTPGGKAKNYAFYTQIEVKRTEFFEENIPGKNKKVQVGQVIKVTTKKNKQAPPRQAAEVHFFFRDAPQHGMKRGEYDFIEELLTLGLFYDVIDRRGKFYHVNGEKIEGRTALEDRLREDVDMQEYVDFHVRDIVSRGNKTMPDTEPDDDE